MPRALVIDDKAYIRTTVSMILRAHGFDVTEADSGTAGLKQLEETNFDLAIVDIYMPGVDGVRVIKLIRERTPKLPVVAMSGAQLGSSGRTALDYFPMIPDLVGVPSIKKPFKPDQLMEIVKRAMKADGN
jgi:CheY-like chemotaxis protein